MVLNLSSDFNFQSAETHNEILFIILLEILSGPTLNPSYVQLPNFISQFWSSKGNQVMSIWHVDLNIPGGM